MLKNIKKHTIGITIGLIGSLIFSRIIDPNWDNSIYFLGNLLASFSKSYVDNLYSDVGNGIREVFSYYPYALIYGAFIIFTFLAAILSMRTVYKSFTKNNNSIPEKEREVVDEKKSKKQKKTKKKVSKKEKGLLLIMSFIAVMLFCYILTSAIKHHYTYNLIVYIEKSIDIVAPKINEQQRLELKAKYRLIDNYDKFKSFNQNLDDIAIENDIELPPFKFILK